ncbi:MAG: translation initiation factor IF-2 [Candidatus Babeliales bacterium]
MRVYEIAKLLGVTNKDVLDFLTKKNISVKSHMSALSEDMVSLVEKEFAQEKETKTPMQKAASVAPESPVIISEKKNVSVVETPLAKEAASAASVATEKVIIVEPMTVGQLAEKIQKSATEVITLLLRNNIVCAKNQLLPESAIFLVAQQYGISTKRPEIVSSAALSAQAALTRPAMQKLKEGIERNPIVVILGHVDHGKTTLLDFIRKTKVAQKEKGGITQHLGAYNAVTPHGSIVFLDTPGHDAFSNIRGRGVNVADIAILVVAADDGIMPQTIDAIEKAKAAQLPVVVAINKVDKVDIGRIEAVKREFIRYDMLPEEWGGSVVFVPISAKTGAGVDALLEMIILQSQLMELRTENNKPAIGFILESKLEKGLGPVATVICQQGVLKTGDYFAVGYSCGKVISIINSAGKRLKEVGASVPVQLSGFAEMPAAGDYFQVITQEKYKAFKDSKPVIAAGQKQAFSPKAFKVVIKADTTSSKEAVIDSLQKVFKKMNREYSFIYEGVGDIVESDIVLAVNTGALVLGLHVKVEPNAQRIADKNMIKILRFDIIYKLIEEIELLVKIEEPVKMVMKKIGEAVVRKVFNIKNVGVIAGAYVRDGRFAREGKIIAWRGKERIGEGSIKSLERDRKAVKEVHAGFEFAFLVDAINNWELDDRAECYIEVPQAK